VLGWGLGSGSALRLGLFLVRHDRSWLLLWGWLGIRSSCISFGLNLLDLWLIRL
jgi:hypothetical protein